MTYDEMIRIFKIHGGVILGRGMQGCPTTVLGDCVYLVLPDDTIELRYIASTGNVLRVPYPRNCGSDTLFSMAKELSCQM